MITATTTYAGNTALEGTEFVVPVDAAKKVRAYMKSAGMLGAGTYWGRVFGTALNRAVRAGQSTVTIYTAGFSTGEFSNILYGVLAPEDREHESLVSHVVDARTDQRHMARL